MNPHSAALKRVVDKIQDLPTLPTVVTQLLKLLQNPRTTSAELEGLLAYDPPLVTKVLWIANSSFYGQGSVNTLQQAVLLLGFAAIRSIALSASVFATFPGVGRPGFDRVAFWRHSLAVAVIARMLSRTKQDGDCEEAFIAGLIHDIGKVVLDEFVSKGWQEAIAYSVRNQVPIGEAERQVLGVSHAQVGRWLATRWNLPPHYAATIFYHHRPAIACRGENLVAMVHAADVLARRARLGSGGDALVPELDPLAARRCGLTDGGADQILRDCPGAFDNVCASFVPLIRR